MYRDAAPFQGGGTFFQMEASDVTSQERIKCKKANPLGLDPHIPSMSRADSLGSISHGFKFLYKPHKMGYVE